MTTCPAPALLAPLPRWLAPALSGCALLGVAALAAAGLPVRAEPVAAVFGLLAVGHGVLHRRWWVAAPVAVLAGAYLVVSAAGGWPEGIDLSYPGGRAASAAPAVIWGTGFLVAVLDTALGVRLHRRVRGAWLAAARATVPDGSGSRA